jgi:hypothetical protein
MVNIHEDDMLPFLRKLIAVPCRPDVPEKSTLTTYMIKKTIQKKYFKVNFVLNKGTGKQRSIQVSGRALSFS